MSSVAMDVAIRRANTFDLTNGETKILYYLAHRAGKDHTCWPSLDLICRENRATKPTVSRAISKFCRLGIMHKETFPRAKKRRGRTTNQYVFIVSGDNNDCLTGQLIPDHTNCMNVKGTSKSSAAAGENDMPLKTSGRKDHPKMTGQSAADIMAEIDDQVGETLEDVVDEYNHLPGAYLSGSHRQRFWARAVHAEHPTLGHAKSLTAKDQKWLNEIFEQYDAQAFDFISIIIRHWAQFVDEGVKYANLKFPTKAPGVYALYICRSHGAVFAENKKSAKAQLIASGDQSPHTAIDKPKQDAIDWDSMTTLEAAKLMKEMASGK